MTALPTIQKALITGDHVGVLRGLLDAWRLNRAPEVADMIAHVGLALESSIAPLGVTGPNKAYQAWLARAAWDTVLSRERGWLT